MTPARPFREIVALGAGGFYPAWGRQTMCFLLCGEERALVLDAGTGLGRLTEPAIASRLEGLDRLDVLLSHYHLDHVVGLACLIAAWGRPVRLFAPAPPLVDATPEQALSRLIAPPLFPTSLERFPFSVEVEAYRGDLEIAGVPVRTRRHDHPGGSVGLRFGDQLAYVTDTVADPETATFVQGVEWLLHEVWADDRQAAENPRLVSGHSAATAVAEIAARARVGRLVPVHHHPLRDPRALEALHEELQEELRGAADVAVTILEEGVPVEL
ncbi:MAG TPA: MBL fold metallo-hydrolase [Thermoanaerobaculia bacterium]|nr:MBL fold metallo-hydrolase [Thermoanaerobaculia bacterium]